MLKPALIAAVCAVVLTLLEGCGGATRYLAEQLPSVQNCQHVEYVRDYSNVELKASCDMSRSGTRPE